MAPLRTYSRNSNKPVTSAQAFDMLFVNNLSLKKIYKKKPQTKTLKLRNFSKKLKSVLNDESLHVNVNDTFDRLLKAPQAPCNLCSSGSKISFSKLIPLGNVKNPLAIQYSGAKISSFSNISNGNKSDNNGTHLPQDTTAMSSYFANATPSDIAITESLEVVSDNANNTKFVNSRKKKASMTLRSSTSNKAHTAKSHLAVRPQNVSKSQIFKEPSNDIKSEFEFNPFLTLGVNNIILHSSTPIRSTRRKRVMVHSFSPINTTDPINNSIVESVNELKSWAWSVPKIGYNSLKNGKITMSQSLKDSQTSDIKNNGEIEMKKKLPGRLIMSVKCDTAIPSQSVPNTDIQTFDKALNISCSGHQSKSVVEPDFKNFYKDQITPDIFSQTHLDTSVCSNYLEKLEQRSFQKTTSLSENIEESLLVRAQNEQSIAIHHTPHLSRTNISLKDLFVNLDHNVNFSKFFLANSKISNQKVKQLYVNLSRHSLPKLKTNCFTKYGTRKYLKQTCRKFSSNFSTILQSRNIQDISLLAQRSLMESMVTHFAKNMTEFYGIHKSIEKENRMFENASKRIGKKLSFGLPLDDFNSGILQNQNCSTKLPSSSTLNLSKSETLYSSQSSECFEDTNLNVSRMPKKDYVAQIISVSSDDCDNLADGQATCIPVKSKPTNWMTVRNAYVTQNLYQSLKSEECHTMGNVSSQAMLEEADSTISVNNVEPRESVSLQAAKIATTSPVCLEDIQKNSKENYGKVFKFPNQTDLRGKKVSRTSLLHRRMSTIIVIDLTSTMRETSSVICPEKDRLSGIIEGRLWGTSLSQNYAELSGTSNEVGIGSSLRITSLNDLKRPDITARDIILKYCEQTDAEPFEKLFPDSLLKNCKKIGEGAYGEVFMYNKSDGSSVVMKVIPIEGDVEINGDRQKKFHEILPEATIASTLSQLRENKLNCTSAFCELQRLRCVKGRYPERLLRLWHKFATDKGSENECPDVFDNEQLYIIFELSNAGENLESFVFSNAQQALSLFKQVAYALAVAEEEVGFEHRDLHLGNVLVQKISKSSFASFKLKGRLKRFRTYGVKATIIDFTLSRMSSDGVSIFTDLADDPELFTSQGNYQFDIYRLMRDKTENNWKKFTPYTNVLWLHFLLVQSVTVFRYRHTKTKIHNMCKCDLIKFRDNILNYGSVSEFVSCLK